jgi:iron complex transport system ATP-binding protein
MDRSHMNTLHTEQLAAGHRGKALFTGVDLRYEGGALIALVGVNGSGKSTLLRCLAGLHAPLSGTVKVNDRTVHALDARERARTVSVVMPGRTSALLDVRASVALGRQPWTGYFGQLEATDERAVDAALEATGIAQLAGRSVASLSDGEHQLMTIARAIAQDTPIVLLDEPTAFLDVVNRIVVVRRLALLARELGRIILFSTHDLQVAVDHADSLLLLQGGKAHTGAPLVVLRSEAMRTAFSTEGLQFDPVTRSLR